MHWLSKKRHGATFSKLRIALRALFGFIGSGFTLIFADYGDILRPAKSITALFLIYWLTRVQTKYHQSTADYARCSGAVALGWPLWIGLTWLLIITDIQRNKVGTSDFVALFVADVTILGIAIAGDRRAQCWRWSNNFDRLEVLSSLLSSARPRFTSVPKKSAPVHNTIEALKNYHDGSLSSAAGQTRSIQFEEDHSERASWGRKK